MVRVVVVRWGEVVVGGHGFGSYFFDGGVFVEVGGDCFFGAHG